MVYSFSDAKIQYDFLQRGAERTVVFLHGWGRTGEDFRQIADAFESYNVLLLDFPPFGESSFKMPFPSIFTYVNMLISLCEHLGISSADFVGHSFGGRILILLAVLKSSLVHSCIFVDSAGLKPKRKLSYRIKVFRYKIAIKFNKNFSCGSRDYLSLSPDMRELFKNIVNTHLDDFAKKIKQKTLIVWGEKDKETPLYMGRRLNKFIINSRIEIIKEASHFPFMDNKMEFVLRLKRFLKEQE